MSSDRRPGGLTALAVINFIFAAFSLLGAIGFIPLLLMNDQMTENMDEQGRATIDALAQTGESWLILIIAGGLITVALLVASGIGYLKLKRFLGRTLGNVYAVFSMASTVITAPLVAPELGGGFGIGTLVSFIYPVLTLILLNTTFKEDLVH